MRSLLVLVLLAATAHADPPKAATRGLMVALGDGSLPLASLVDPARGVWVVDGTQRTLVCGKDLVDLIIEAQVHAGWWGRTAECRNQGDRATCVLSSGVHSWRLEFERGGGSLVWRTFVTGADPVADPPHGDRCPAGSKLPAEPPAYVPAARRDAPEGDQTPTVATVAMLYHFARGEWQLADFVDTERGLVILDNPPDATDDASIPKRNTRVCGPTLRAELAAIQARLPSPKMMADDTDMHVSCGNGRSASGCTLSVIGEWGPVSYLHFRQTPHGLVLDMFTVNDEHQVPSHELEGQSLSAALALAHAWLAPCP